MEIEIDIDRLYHDLQEHFGSTYILAKKNTIETARLNSAHDCVDQYGLPDVWHDRINAAATMIPSITQGFWSGSLGDIDTMYELGNYQGLVDLALAEGFDLMNYEVT